MTTTLKTCFHRFDSHSVYYIGLWYPLISMSQSHHMRFMLWIYSSEIIFVSVLIWIPESDQEPVSEVGNGSWEISHRYLLCLLSLSTPERTLVSSDFCKHPRHLLWLPLWWNLSIEGCNQVTFWAGNWEVLDLFYYARLNSKSNSIKSAGIQLSTLYYELSPHSQRAHNSEYRISMH